MIPTIIAQFGLSISDEARQTPAQAAAWPQNSCLPPSHTLLIGRALSNQSQSAIPHRRSIGYRLGGITAGTVVSGNGAVVGRIKLCRYESHNTTSANPYQKKSTFTSEQ